MERGQSHHTLFKNGVYLESGRYITTSDDFICFYETEGGTGYGFSKGQLTAKFCISDADFRTIDVNTYACFAPNLPEGIYTLYKKDFPFSLFNPKGEEIKVYHVSERERHFLFFDENLSLIGKLHQKNVLISKTFKDAAKFIDDVKKHSPRDIELTNIPGTIYISFPEQQPKAFQDLISSYPTKNVQVYWQGEATYINPFGHVCEHDYPTEEAYWIEF